MFSGSGKGGGGGAGPMPFSSFSNHPLAGGSGASGGAGMVRAASTPGSGGAALQTALMANLVGNGTASVAVELAASSGAVGGLAPVAAGGAGMGGMGMMGHRGESGGTASSLAMPAALGYDVPAAAG